MKITKTQEAIFWSWLYAALVAVATYVGEFLTHSGQHWNWAIVGWAALAGFLAPLARALNKRNPEFSLFTKAVTDTVAKKAAPKV